MRIDCGICVIRPFRLYDKSALAVATAPIHGLVPWAFEAFQLERIYATPFHWNLASCRALEKASFNKEGVMRRAALKDGVVADVPVYARLRSS